MINSSEHLKSYFLPSRKTVAVLQLLAIGLLILSIIFLGKPGTYMSGTLAILLCLLLAPLTSLIGFLTKDTKGGLSFLWLLPGSVILAVGLSMRFPAFILVAIIILSVGLADKIYHTYISDTVVNDLGVAAPLILVVIIYPFDLGVVSQNVISQIYGGIFQSFIALIGLLFSLGILVFSFRKASKYDQIANMLATFLLLFILVAILALIGMLNSREDIDLSSSFLFPVEPPAFRNIFQASLIMGTLALTLSSLTSLISVFGLFVRHTNRRP